MSKDALNPAGFQQLTVNSTTVPVTLTIPARAVRAVITCETDNIRYRVDGTAPTSTVGTFIEQLQSFELESSFQLANFQAVLDTSASQNATLDIHYYQLH